jgi:hypothetical protein
MPEPSNPPASPTNGCPGTNAAGAPCRATTMTGRAWCWHHDPDLAGARRDARALGGRHRSTIERARRRLPGEVSAMLDVIVATFHSTARGDGLPAGTAQALAALAGAYVRLHDVGEHDLALEELEAQLADLEAVTRPKGLR